MFAWDCRAAHRDLWREPKPAGEQAQDAPQPQCCSCPGVHIHSHKHRRGCCVVLQMFSKAFPRREDPQAQPHLAENISLVEKFRFGHLMGSPQGGARQSIISAGTPVLHKSHCLEQQGGSLEDEHSSSSGQLAIERSPPCSEHLPEDPGHRTGICRVLLQHLSQL